MQRTFVPFVLAAALGACVATNGDEGIFITKNVAPGDGCTFTSDPNEPFVSHGRIDVFSPAPYLFHAQMQSKITASDAQLDARTILMRGARVDLEFADKDLFTDAELATLKESGATHFQSLFAAPLRPNGGITDAGFTAIPVEALQAVAAKAPTTGSFRTEVLAKVKVFGDMSGDEVQSQEFVFPITICNDCVVNVLETTTGTAATCPVGPDVDPSPGNACNRYQDGTVDCCTASDGLHCPAPVATTP